MTPGGVTGRRRGRQIVGHHGGYLCCAGDERSLAVPSWEHPDHLVRGDRQHLALFFCFTLSEHERGPQLLSPQLHSASDVKNCCRKLGKFAK